MNRIGFKIIRSQISHFNFNRLLFLIWDCQNPITILGVWIHQDAWFSMGKFEKEVNTSYTLNKQGNGMYFFVLEGEIEVEGQKLSKRDGFGIWDIDQVKVKSFSNSRVLLMEVPMSV